MRCTTCVTGPCYFISIPSPLPEKRQYSLFTSSIKRRDDTLSATARAASCSVSLRDIDTAIIEMHSEAKTFGGCLKRVIEVLEGVFGVHKASVDLKTKTATVMADSDISQIALIAFVKEHSGKDEHLKDAFNQSVSTLA